VIPKEVQFPDTPFALAPSLALLGRRGSEAHGTYCPPENPDSIDDRDLMGVVLPPLPWVLGLRQWEGTEAIKGVWDVVLYDFRKFVRLLVKQNPNVIAMLWLEPEDYLHVGKAGQRLLGARALFRCRSDAYNSFVGYAHGQLKKMTGGVFRGYMGERRKQLVARIGYDAKNASHLVRLLHMGDEFLRTGVMQVRRTWDREMLIRIKRGEWTLEQVQRYASDYFETIRKASLSSDLPESIDDAAVEALVLECMGDRVATELELGCPNCCKACLSATGGQCSEHQEPECTCYEITGGHMPGCAFNRTRT